MPFALVRQSVHECLPCWARLRPDDQVDVGDLIPIAYQRFADEEIRCHNYLPIRMGSTSADCRPLRERSLGGRGCGGWRAQGVPAVLLAFQGAVVCGGEVWVV